MAERIISDESGDTTVQVTLEDLLQRLNPAQQEIFLNRLSPAQQEALLSALNGEQAGALQVLLEGIAQSEQQEPEGLTRRRDYAGEQTRELARGLAAQGIPYRAGLIREALAKQTALQAGSQTELYQTLRPQLSALQGRLDDAFKAIDRRLGPSGGGVARRARTQVLSQTAQDIQQLLQQALRAGFGGVLETVSGTRPGITANLAPIGQSSASGSFGNLGGLAASTIDLAKRLFPGQQGVSPDTNQLSQGPLTQEAALAPEYDSASYGYNAPYQGSLSGDDYTAFGGQVGAPGE